MFRKFFAVLVALTLVVGGLFADDITGVFKKFEDGKVTVEVDGKEKSYKVNADAKIKAGKKEILLTDAFKNWKADQKGTFVVEKDEVISAKKVK
jgi:D-lyxose ketol-isomerase